MNAPPARLAVRRHDVVPELRRVGDVLGEERGALALRALGRQVGRAEVATPLAEVGVALEAADLGEEAPRPPTALRVPGGPPSAPTSGTSATTSEPSDSFAVAPFQVRTAIDAMARMAVHMATGRRSGCRSALRSSTNGNAISSRSAERRDADRPEDDRLRPLEDPEQVEEEVEVPVGRRDGAHRPGVGGLVVQLPEPARLGAVWSPGVGTSRSPRAR